jgi:hypothetical protein
MKRPPSLPSNSGTLNLALAHKQCIFQIAGRRAERGQARCHAICVYSPHVSGTGAKIRTHQPLKSIPSSCAFLSRLVSMGVAFSSLWSSLFGQKELKVCILGLDNAGS